MRVIILNKNKNVNIKRMHICIYNMYKNRNANADIISAGQNLKTIGLIFTLVANASGNVSV